MRAIAPFDNNGSITIQFQLEGQTYKFNPIKGAKFSDKIALGRATALATQISLDLSLGCFDATLEKYRDIPAAAPIQKPAGKRGNAKLIDLWDAWVESLDLAASTKADHYEMVRRMILKSGAVSVRDSSWLQPFKETLAPATFNKRLGYLKSCLNWAIDEQHFNGKNPYLAVKSMKAGSKDKDVDPFSKAEVQSIVQCCREYYPEYVDFLQFLFQTGVRPGEAIALQWKHLDFEYKLIKIGESLSIDKAGKGYQRVRKSTKTGKVRYLPMTESLAELLQSIKSESCNPEGLVFCNSEGRNIEPNWFRRNVWKPLLARLGLRYRKLYQTRHTLLSHAAMDPNIGILGAADIAGHTNSRMVVQHYARFVGQTNLPDLDF